MYWRLLLLSATILLPLAIGTMNFKSLTKAQRFFFLSIVWGTITEATLFGIAYFGGRPNVPFIHISSALELLTIGLFFYYELKHPIIRTYLPPALVGAVVFSVVYATIGDNFFQFPSVPRAIDAVILVVCGFYYFYEIATIGTSEDPFYNRSFLITGGILIYFTSTFIIWVSIKYVITDMEIVGPLYGSHAYINAFCNLFFGLALWTNSNSKSLSYPS